MQTSIVPEAGHTTYLLMDEIGEYGNVWREMSEGEATEATIVQWMIDGEINRPVKIVAFNTEEGWSRDVFAQTQSAFQCYYEPGLDRSRTSRDIPDPCIVGTLRG